MAANATSFVYKFCHYSVMVSHMLFGLTYSYGYHSYLSRLNDDIMNTSKKELDLLYTNFRGNAIGCLLKLFVELEGSISMVFDASVVDSFYLCKVFFIECLAKKIIEKCSLETMQMIDSRTIGLIRGKVLICKWDFMNVLYSSQQYFSNPFEMIQVVTKMLVDILFKKSNCKIVSEFGLKAIKEVLEKIKQTLQLAEFLELESVNSTLKSLLELKDRAYSSIDFQEQRKLIFEAIGNCLFEDENDDYLFNITKISSSIFDQHVTQETVRSQHFESHVVQLFADLSGMMKAVSSTKVAIAIIRICYPKVRQVLNDHCNPFIGKDSFILAVVQFYEAMNDFVFDKFTSISFTTYLDVLKDSFKLMTTFCKRGC